MATTSQEREQTAKVVLENIERAQARQEINYDKKVLTGKVILSFLIGQNGNGKKMTGAIYYPKGYGQASL